MGDKYEDTHKARILTHTKPHVRPKTHTHTYVHSHTNAHTHTHIRDAGDEDAGLLDAHHGLVHLELLGLCVCVYVGGGVSKCMCVRV